jgi:hypothetical protein
MRSVLVVLCLILLKLPLVFGQEWKRAFERPKCFIENLGQFDSYQNQQTGPIKFAADFGKAMGFFIWWSSFTKQNQCCIVFT